MPRLPDYTDLGQRPIPQSQAPVASYDVARAAGAGFGALASAADDIYRKLQEREDLTAFMTGRRQLDEWHAAKVTDPTNGAVAKQGRDAFGLEKTLPAEFDAYAGQVIAAAPSERVKARLSELAMSRREQLSNWTASHVLQAREKVEDADFKTNMIGLRRAAGVETDPARLDEHLAVARGYITARLQRTQGAAVDTKLIDAAVADEASGAYYDAIHLALARKDTAIAKNLMDAALKKGALNPNQQATLQGELSKQVAFNTADTVQREVWATLGPKTPRDAVKDNDLEQAIKDDPRINTPELRAAALEMSRAQVRAFEAQQKAADGPLVEAVYGMRKAGVPPIRIRQSAEWKSMTAVRQSQIDDHWEQQDAARESRQMVREGRDLQRLQREEAMRAAQDRKKITDNFASYIRYTNPEVLAGVADRNELLALRPQFGDAGVEHLTRLWDTVQSSQGRLDAKLTGEEYERAFTRIYGMGPTEYVNKNPVKKDEVMLFRANLDAVLDQAQAEKKRRLMPQERADVISQAVATDKIKTSTMVFDLLPDTVHPLSVNPSRPGLSVVLSETQKAKVIEDLKGKGITNPTQEQINIQYLRGLGRTGTIYGR